MNFLCIESIVDGADDVLVNIKPKEKLKKKKKCDWRENRE